jgi:hypothetical protein
VPYGGLDHRGSADLAGVFGFCMDTGCHVAISPVYTVLLLSVF